MDFAALYPSVPLENLKHVMTMMVKIVFAAKKAQANCSSRERKVPHFLIAVSQYPDRDKAYWVEAGDEGCCSPDESVYSESELIKMIFWLLDNAFSTFGNKIYRQTTGIPTGTNAAPELTQLYLLYYELSFFCRSLSKGWSNLPTDLQTLILTYQRYIDDIFRLRLRSSPSEKYLYDQRSSGGPDGMYPVLLQNDDGTVNHMPLRLTIESGETVPFLDTSVSLIRGVLSWRLYNKREHMFVDGVRLSDLRNFPHIETKLSDTVKYGIVTSGLYRFAMINKMAFDFIREAARMVKKMIQAGYDKAKVMDKVIRFQGWNKNLGEWHKVLRKLLRQIREETPL